MKKIIFDNSIHLGQFCTSSEAIRIASKNSQVSISPKGQDEVFGFVTFNENSWSDHLIWGLEREPQDAFYRFMDPFHSVKNIHRIPLRNEDSQKALELANQLGVDISNALTCAVAITEQVNEVHSFYEEMGQQKVKDYMREQHSVLVVKPEGNQELSFSEEGLEHSYQEALTTFQKHGIDLYSQFHS